MTHKWLVGTEDELKHVMALGLIALGLILTFFLGLVYIVLTYS